MKEKLNLLHANLARAILIKTKIVQEWKLGGGYNWDRENVTFLVAYGKRLFSSNGQLVLNQGITEEKKESYLQEGSLLKAVARIFYTSSFPVPNIVPEGEKQLMHV